MMRSVLIGRRLGTTHRRNRGIEQSVSLSLLSITRTTASAKTTAPSSTRVLLPSHRRHTRLSLTSITVRPSSTTNTQNTSRKFNETIWFPILGALTVTTLGGIKYFHDHVGGSEGLLRSISFYSLAIPKYLVYRYHSWRQSPDHVWDELDTQTSQQGLIKILELQGFYIKCGQLCATNMGDAFPPIWRDTMSILQDQVPPQEFHVIKSIVEKELNFDKTFASFDPVPVGAASIGQVHRAVLREGNKPVVVKVCYPNVERLLRGDVRTIKLFAKVAQPVHVPSLEEIEVAFQTEFDYQKEALNLQTVRDNLTKAGYVGPDKMCVVPKPYMEYCTKHVLVMEELNGEKLPQVLQQDVANHARLAGQTVDEFLQTQQEKQEEFERRTGDKYQGPTAKEMDLYIGIVDTKRKLANMKNRIYNATVAWWLPRSSKDHLTTSGETTREGPSPDSDSGSSDSHSYKDKSVLPLNHAKLVDDLLEIHGHEALVDGFLNADPHPGNFFICRRKDGSPQLGLIDYGQVKTLTKEQRHLFCRLLIALDDEDKELVVKLMKEAGFKSERMDEEVMYLYAKVGYDMDTKELTNGKHIQMFMEDIQARDPIISLPKDFMMVSRASLFLRGLAHALHQSRSVAKSWRPIAERVLREDL